MVLYDGFMRVFMMFWNSFSDVLIRFYDVCYYYYYYYHHYFLKYGFMMCFGPQINALHRSDPAHAENMQLKTCSGDHNSMVFTAGQASLTASAQRSKTIEKQYKASFARDSTRILTTFR